MKLTSVDTKRGVVERFSASAATYDKAAHIQARIAQDLAAMIVSGERPPKVLEIGGGTGILTRLLHDRLPGAVLHVLEPSERMLAQCRERMGTDGAVRYHLMDFLSFPETQRFPLVASNAALHWIDPIESACAKLGRLVAPGGRFAATVMVDGTLRELREAREAVVPTKPPSARLPAAARVDAALRACGFQIHHSRTEPIYAAYPEARSFLSAVHRMGVTAGPFSRGARPLQRGELDRLIAYYNDTYPHPPAGVVATYVIHFIDTTRSSNPL